MPEWMNISEMALEQPEKRLHVERYEYAANALRGKRMLDCACGMGYGTAILGATAHGVDIDPEAIGLAQQSYPGGSYAVGDLYAVPLDGFDALVSFETLEHLDRPAEIIDRLPPTVSDIVASVPIRPTVGWNPWHRSDFTKDTFRELIQSGGFRIIHELPQMWVDGADLYLMVHGRRA